MTAKKHDDAPKHDAPKKGDEAPIQPKKEGGAVPPELPGMHAPPPGEQTPPYDAPQAKEKQQDAPATSENEQVRLRQERAARDQEKQAAAATDPEGHLKPHLQAIQARSEKEPNPRVHRLIIPKKDEMGQPVAEPPKAPPPNAGGPVPRFVHENERAPEGLTRYRVREDGVFGQQPVRHVLARGPEEAMQHYLRGTGLDSVIYAMGEEAPRPRLSVVRLPD